MLFAELADYFKQLEKTTSRNLITEILADLFSQLGTEEIDQAVYLSLGGLRPKFDRLEMQLADKMVVRALAKSFNLAPEVIVGEYKRLGDLGEVAEKYKDSTRLPARQGSMIQDLSVTEVYNRLVEIAKESGSGSQERKLNLLTKIIGELDNLSVKYLIRMVLGRLRLGFSEMTILDALAVMDNGSKSGRAELELSYQVFSDIGRLAQLVKAYGVKGVTPRVSVTMGVPVVPALCQRLKTAKEMIDKMGDVIAEPKFDGTRVQIHIDKTSWGVKTYTRNLDETTFMFPELVKAMESVDAQKVILDGEAVGFNPKTGAWLPFQETITRKRIHNVSEAVAHVPLKFMVFDLLYCNGESFLNKPLIERREKLKRIIKPNPVIQVDEELQTQNAEELKQYHKKKLAQGLEGVVIKQTTGIYEPGRRGFNWVKFKEVEESQAKLADTIDLVVMGFYRGKGKRTQFGIGAFLVGMRENEKIKTIAKIGTGLTDEQWRELRKRLEANIAMVKPTEYEVNRSLEPDVWTDPKVVVEIAADEITKSPIHSIGYALRFPRLVKFRDDKSLEQTTSKTELMTIRG